MGEAAVPPVSGAEEAGGINRRRPRHSRRVAVAVVVDTGRTGAALSACRRPSSRRWTVIGRAVRRYAIVGFRCAVDAHVADRRGRARPRRDGVGAGETLPRDDGFAGYGFVARGLVARGFVAADALFLPTTCPLTWPPRRPRRHRRSGRGRARPWSGWSCSRRRTPPGATAANTSTTAVHAVPSWHPPAIAASKTPPTVRPPPSPTVSRTDPKSWFRTLAQIRASRGTGVRLGRTRTVRSGYGCRGRFGREQPRRSTLAGLALGQIPPPWTSAMRLAMAIRARAPPRPGRRSTRRNARRCDRARRPDAGPLSLTRHSSRVSSAVAGRRGE